MKRTLLLSLIICVFQLKAQDVKQFSFNPSGNISEITLKIENLYADLEIVGISSSEISIDVNGYKGIPEKAKGLKPLSATGPDNTGIGLYMAQEGAEVMLSGAHRDADRADYQIKLPRNIMLKIEYGSFQAGDITIRGMQNEVEVKSQIGDLVFEDVTGPIVASTLSADINVVFGSVAQQSPTSITSTSGDVDITIPGNTKANFKLSSTSGEVYTDLDFTIPEEDGMKRWGGGMSANTTLNGGGVEISLRSISGDIFIREAK